MDSLNTYFDFAENDFMFFDDAYKHGILGSPMAAMGQNICERYFKHIVSEYSNPETKEENQLKIDILRTHSLSKLIHYIEENMKLDIPRDTKINAKMIDGFYFSTRYPGENSFLPTKEDIEDTYNAVNRVRNFTIECERKFGYPSKEVDKLFSEASSEDLAEFKTKPKHIGDAYEKTEDSCSDEVKDEGQDQTSSVEEHQVDSHNIGDDDMDELL